MGTHPFVEHPWRVRVAGHERGAGVLLDERHVLTCAHLVGDEDEQVWVHSAVGTPEWRITARVAVVPGSWRDPGHDARRGDVAMLVLHEPVPADTNAKLWCVPLSGGQVRAFGFPRAEPYGIWADAELGGDGGPGGGFGLLNQVRDRRQWIEPGFSGAGVVMRDGDHAGHVIGIIVADYRNADARGAWMMPTEAIRRYLPDVARYVAGEPTDRLGSSSDTLPRLAPDDALRVVLTQELKRLLTSGWAGTVVLPGGTGTGTDWLVRLVRTADPVTRAGASDAELTGAPEDTVLKLGTVDAAYDARGKFVAEVASYLAERFGLPAGEPDLVRRLLRRKPPACIVIDGVDRAESPDTLIREMVRPLALGARSHGIRLVLGFDRIPPATLPYDVSLAHGPLAGDPSRSASGADAEAAVGKLADAEAGAAQLNSKNEGRFRKPPTLPHARAPRLRVRLAVARVTEPNPELAAICEQAALALGEAASFTRRLQQLDKDLKNLRDRLDAHLARARRIFGDAEKQPFGDVYDQADSALWVAPIDLAAAGELVERYVTELDRYAHESRQSGEPGREDRG